MSRALSGLILGAIGCWLFFGMAFGAFMGVVGCFVLFGAVWLLCLGALRIMIAVSGRRRELSRMLDRVRNGDTGLCESLERLFPPDPDDGGLAEILDGLREEGSVESDAPLYQADGTAKRVTAESIKRGSGKYAQYFIGYTFSCAGRTVAFEIGEDTPALHALFRPNHPYILAEGDRVRLIVGADGRTVKAMRNFEDGCAYLFGSLSPRKLRIVYKGIAVIPVALPLLMMLFAMLDHGFSLRTVWREAELLLMSFGIGLGCTVLGMAILWLCVTLQQRFGSFRADLPYILKALELDAKPGKRKSYIHEL